MRTSGCNLRPSGLAPYLTIERLREEFKRRIKTLLSRRSGKTNVRSLSSRCATGRWQASESEEAVASFLSFEAEKRGAIVTGFDADDVSRYQHVPCKNKPDHSVGFPMMRNGYWLAHAAYRSEAKVIYGGTSITCRSRCLPTTSC
jgi:hypothetical protein